jgi:thiosulfate/3-mercaptopyruvate sulfurtransferase
VAPVESHLKVLVEKEFLDSDHGKVGCADCHGGNSNAQDMKEAHKGIIRDPTYPDPSKVCGECHEAIAKNSRMSLHYSLAPYQTLVGKRATKDKAVLDKLAQAQKNHCTYCHSSCGQCHISRPTSVEGGLLAKHRFVKTPSMENNCTACHGSRVGMEFQGKNSGIPADTHFTSQAMTCTHCHKADEMHGDGKTDHADRYDQSNGPQCLNCHKDAAPGKGKNKSHNLHAGKLSCQVCHSVQYKNCYRCHVGLDKKGLPYYKNEPSRMGFKIGLNPNPTPRRPSQYVTVRHIPTYPETFKYYVAEGLKNFDQLPTWKYTTPHNIQLITPQNEKCENCHGNPKLFLTVEDVDSKEREANQGIIVPVSRLPGPVKK